MFLLRKVSMAISPLISEPVIVGSILIGADDVVGELVRSRIPHMRDGEWGPFKALGVIRRNKLVGGVVYHGYRGFDTQMSCAFEGVGWALPGTVRALLAYPFETLGVRRVTAITGRKNKRARKLLEDLGFVHEGMARRGLDGFEDAFLFGLLKEHCKWLKADGQKNTASSRAA